ncbi:MAG: DUF1998 domain-containing protein, partial [Synergistaceae bacterium]|nr:DUF1998 domain-containing protein [Synergistaceae bacterium]
LAPIFLMCDSNDIYVNTAISEPTLRQPAIFLSDAIPGGVGLAEGAYIAFTEILKACLEQLDSCGCREGCPSCIGTVKKGIDAKKLTKYLIKDLLNN